VALDVTDATFQSAVYDRSFQVPVVVDLWAEWCGPCKQLGPVLERVVAATDGAVELAKVDVDSSPQVASMFKVQSIPAVFAIAKGQVVDSFVGALPEARVSEFVTKLAPVQPPADEAEGPEHAAMLRSRDRALAAALERITPDQRTAILLYDIEGYDYQEIADMQGVSLGTVKSRIHRGRLALRDILTPQMDLFHD
jgi:thioredoxin